MLAVSSLPVECFLCFSKEGTQLIDGDQESFRFDLDFALDESYQQYWKGHVWYVCTCTYLVDSWGAMYEHLRVVPPGNAFVCHRAHARKYSGAAKTHTAEQHGSPQRGSRGSSHNQGPAIACDLLLAS